MFGVGYEVNGEKFFKVCEDMTEAQNEANNISCMGICEVTVYDYDTETKTFMEFYTV